LLKNHHRNFVKNFDTKKIMVKNNYFPSSSKYIFYEFFLTFFHKKRKVRMQKMWEKFPFRVGDLENSKRTAVLHSFGKIRDHCFSDIFDGNFPILLKNCYFWDFFFEIFLAYLDRKIPTNFPEKIMMATKCFGRTNLFCVPWEHVRTPLLSAVLIYGLPNISSPGFLWRFP